MSKKSTSSFGSFARQVTRKLGKSQRSLAKALNVSPAYVSQVFSGKKNPPDLGRPRNRGILKIWSEFLNTCESDLVDLARHEIHKTPLPPSPKFPRMRKLLLLRLDKRQKNLTAEIRAMGLHPAEQQIISLLTQIYLVQQKKSTEHYSLSYPGLMDFVSRISTESSFVDTKLCDHFDSLSFTWTCDLDLSRVDLVTTSPDVKECMGLIRKMHGNNASSSSSFKIPVVGNVTAGRGFDYADVTHWAGKGFDEVPAPPGIQLEQPPALYCIRVEGDTLKDFFGNGTLLFIKPESWQDIIDGDFVIYRDSKILRAFVKKIEFTGDSLILKPLNSAYKSVVCKPSSLKFLERVIAVVF